MYVRIRKTRDVYVVQGFYCGEWEDVTAENSRKEVVSRIKEYRLNESGTSFRWRTVREKI